MTREKERVRAKYIGCNNILKCVDDRYDWPHVGHRLRIDNGLRSTWVTRVCTYVGQGTHRYTHSVTNQLTYVCLSQKPGARPNLPVGQSEESSYSIEYPGGT